MARRHIDLWSWVMAIKKGETAQPFVGIWPRGGGKSTTAEAASVALGVRGRRGYCLYVRETQPQADKSVGNIAALLESPSIARFYPDHAERKVGKFGNSKGWRREQLRTAGGFTVDALGLEVASRGVKVEEQRPDLIIFDDIDGLHDSPAATAKKIETITKSILPAGSNDCVVLFIQNQILRDGVASQLVDRRADFLANREVSGPFPAVVGLKTEWKVEKSTGMRRAVITAGKATWEGQNLDTCQRNIDQWGLSAFLKEAQHQVQGKAEGVCLRFDDQRHYLDLTDDQVVELSGKSRAFAGIDFGAWRFGFTLWFMTQAGTVIRIDEFFSQRESLGDRAKRIHEMCEANGIDDPSPKTVPIWGDAANPQDIMEINLAFKAGWADDRGRKVTSKLRVIAVGSENKLRKVAVERINNALDQDGLKFRRLDASRHVWVLGMNAGSEGTETHGSRLMWEIDNWAVPVPKAGHAQDQNPDDDSADGADMIASARYALMSWWKPARKDRSGEDVDEDASAPWDYAKKRQIQLENNIADIIQPYHRITPRIEMPRFRMGG
ncbi:MAG: hypothetical protein ACYCVE_11120 [Gemmatimonadaceae bacterium]